jgi:hypothetical protein
LANDTAYAFTSRAITLAFVGTGDFSHWCVYRAAITVVVGAFFPIIKVVSRIVSLDDYAIRVAHPLLAITDTLGLEGPLSNGYSACTIYANG